MITTNICKIIHQTWKDNNPPDKYHKFINSWKENHPDYEYKLWTDEDNDNLVRTDFPEFYEMYKGFNHFMMRVDFARYCILYKYGGVYVDLDFECIKPIDMLLYNRKIVLGSVKEEVLGSIVEIAFVATVKNHNIWKDMMYYIKYSRDSIIDNLYKHIFGSMCMVGMTTGPIAFTNFLSINKAYDTKDMKILSPVYLYPKNWMSTEFKTYNEYNESKNINISPKTYAIHHYEDSWLDETVKKRMFLLYKYKNTFKYIFIVLGLVFLIYTIYLTYNKYRRE